MHIRVVLITAALLLLAPSAAFASLAEEQNQGRELAAQLQSGAKACGDLSGDDFEHIGEYVMGRMLGSTSVHQAMNDRMQLMMGAQDEQRLHQLMGERFTGCATGSAGTVMGPGMTGGSSGNGNWGPMMSSRDYGWMMGGAWRNMSRQDWQRLQQQWLGTSATTSSHGLSGWAIAAIAAAGTLLIAAVATLVLTHRPSRRRTAATSPS